MAQPIGKYYEVPIPLFSGRHAVLQIPAPLSREDYEHLKSMTNIMLNGMEETLVDPIDDDNQTGGVATPPAPVRDEPTVPA